MIRYGFIGNMQSGKDTACDILLEHFGGEVMAFAKPVYEIEEFIWKTVGLPIPKDKTLRRPILQLIGTEIGRDNIDKNIWLDVFQRSLGQMNFSNVFVRDCRFPNEAERLVRLGFRVFKIERPDKERRRHEASHESHASETEIANIPSHLITATITNDGTLAEFREKILRLPGQYPNKALPKIEVPGYLFTGIE